MLSTSHLYKEIHEQPVVLSRFLREAHASMLKLVKLINNQAISHVIIAGRGTSDNAGRYAKYVLGALNGLPVSLATPSLYSLYKQPPNLQNALVLGISQSGQSPDIVGVLAEAQRQGVLSAAITNDPESPLAEVADVVIPLHAGSERAVAATKTYTASLAAVALLSAMLSGNEDRLAELYAVPKVVESTLGMSGEIAGISPRYRYMKHCVVIGRGFNYATAFEIALKLKELTYTIVEPYSSADFLHGPLALIDEGFPVMVLAPTGVLLPELSVFIKTLQARGAEVIGISDDEDLLAKVRIGLKMPASLPEWLSPMTTIVAGQLFAMHLTLIKNYDPDQSRGIQKVTKTV